MAATVVADTGFLVALLRKRDAYREWANAQAQRHGPPWHTCEPVLTEVLHIMGMERAAALIGLCRRGALQVAFSFADNRDAVLELMEKYADVPMNFADACLVRMSEILPNPIILTTDSDFRVYRRHSRQVVPCVTPR